MYDVAIVGAGLCGLALAEMLESKGKSVLVLEARARIGGRILTHPDPGTGLALDLGPTWFWPESQPHMAGLVARLGISSFPQRDTGSNLSLSDIEQGPRETPPTPLHAGAHRVENGMQALVDALVRQLAKSDIRLSHVLQSVTDEGDHVRFSWTSPRGAGEDLARTCVLALPPRLVASLTFSPSLDHATLSALRHTPTWMATTAKALTVCARADWRLRDLSGSAFVSHEQAVLGEIWDACSADGARAALGAFLALPPSLRRDFAQGLPMLIASQWTQLFGQDLNPIGEAYHDWAQEDFTCSAADLAAPGEDFPARAEAILRTAHWHGRLHFAGSETAAHDPGRLEGALDAAQRVAREIEQAHQRADLLAHPGNRDALRAFSTWVQDQRTTAFSTYRASLSRSLMRQDREQLTQRALLMAVESVLGEALTGIAAMPLEGAGMPLANGQACLLPLVQAPFKRFLDTLLEDVREFNATSCALSNFPDEHRPSRAYTNAMLRDVAAAWAEFSQEANRILLGARPSQTASHGAA